MTDLPVSIRLNPFKLKEFEGERIPWSPWGRILSERPVFTLDPLFHAGAYYVQDSSAMYVGHIFRKVLSSMHDCSDLRCLDLCAAPGGKTTDMAASLREARGDRWTLFSNELMKARLGVLRDNVARWGDPRIMVTGADPAAFGKNLKGYFDIIVADVPCSGEGMFRKDAKARQMWGEDTVGLCAARQKRILADVWPALRQGGWLIYSTCTYNSAENDDNLQWAAAELGGRILPPLSEFASFGVETTPAGNLLKAGVSLGEGQWVGALQKTAPQDEDPLCRPEVLHPMRTGTIKGEAKGADFVPDADYALSLNFNRSEYPVADVDRLTALKFLHRDSIVLPGAPKGYNIICYDGLPLGFVKNLGKRCNNLLPQQRRILMDIK